MAHGTLFQKILDQHLRTGAPQQGDQVGIKIDQTLTQDATGTMAYLELEGMNVPRVKTEISVSYVDHNMQQNGPENHNDHLYLQTIAAQKGIYFSRPGNGICHQVHLERFGKPGKTLLGSDSHTPTGGGIGMIAIGAGGLDVALAMAGQPFRLIYPKIIGVELSGKLAPWVAAKDVILYLLSILTTKGNVGCVIEYFGPGVNELTVPQRATITNMGAELGVTTSIFPSDEQTKQFLTAQNRASDFIPLSAENDAEYDRVIKIDLSTLKPLAACPSSPDQIRPIAELSGLSVSQVIIGSCTNSSFRDLMLVAAIAKGRHIHPAVSASIAPGSKQVMEMLGRNGALADLIASGFRILESGCGPCIGQGFSPADDTISVRTFNRNFLNRSGTTRDQVYLTSPETAVIAALTGKLTDPRTLDFSFPNIENPTQFLINDYMVIPPCSNNDNPIIRKPTIGDPPKGEKLADSIEGVVLIKLGDKITTDHIMPAGIHLKHRSNIPKYAQVVFECFNHENQPSFAQRAIQVKNQQKHGIIVAKESYGQGSSREHAAICPMYLGVKVVIASSIERIHAANLINFGIIPLFFTQLSDYDVINEKMIIKIENIGQQLKPNQLINAQLFENDTFIKQIQLKHQLTQEDIEIIKAGGRLLYQAKD